MKRTWLVLIVGIAFGFASAVVAQKAADKAAKKETRFPASSLKWEKPYGENGPEISVVYGDPKKGPHGTFMRFPAGFKSGWHTYDAGYTAIVIQGSITHLLQGETTAPALPSGSWFSQAGKENHHDECGKEGPCVIFGHIDGPASFNPKTADGKDAPPPGPPAAVGKDAGKTPATTPATGKDAGKGPPAPPASPKK